MNKTERNTKCVSIRATPDQVALIDRAAKEVGKSRNRFMIETATREAEWMLAERTVFTVNEQQWRALHEMLDRPPRDTPRLRRLMREHSVLE